MILHDFWIINYENFDIILEIFIDGILRVIKWQDMQNIVFVM